MKEENLEQKVINYLFDIGASPNYKGFFYLKDILILYLTHPGNRSYGLNSLGYDLIAEKYGVKSTSISQRIDAVIKNIDKSKPLFKQIFNSVWLSDKKITPSFFIYISLNELKHGNIKNIP